MTVRVKIIQDNECPSPAADCCTWTLYSFNRRHLNFHNHRLLGVRSDESGTPVVRNPGLRRRIKTGLAYFVSYYEHGHAVWGLPGEVPNCRFDTTPVAGLLVWESKPSDLGQTTLEARRASARSFLGHYTAWLNGCGAGFIVESIDDDGEVTDDLGSCFGFIVGDKDDARHFFEEIGCLIPPGERVEFTGDSASLATTYPPAWLVEGVKVGI